MISSNLCDYSDAYIIVKGTVTVPNTTAAAVAVNNTNKKTSIKKLCPIYWLHNLTKINNTQVDGAPEIDIVMPMYKFIKNSDVHLKISESLWQRYRDEPAFKANGEIIDFPANNNNSASFKFKQQITGQTRKA